MKEKIKNANICIIKKYKFYDKEFDSVEDAASFFNVSTTLIYGILSGHKKPSKRMLELVGMKRVKTEVVVKVINKQVV